MGKKQQTKEQRELERQSAALLGHHVPEGKGRLLLLFTALACLAPCALGVRLWEKSPPIVETGLIGLNGEDDSLPRWALVFLLPGLFFALDVINHVQLRRFQRLERVPPRYTRLMGRWGFPLVGRALCAWAIPSGAGEGALAGTLFPLWGAGLLLMLAGGHFLDCPRGARFSLGGLPGMDDPSVWRDVHRFAGLCSLAAGLLLLYDAALFPSFPAAAALIVLAGLLPPAYARLRGRR